MMLLGHCSNSMMMMGNRRLRPDPVNFGTPVDPTSRIHPYQVRPLIEVS